jgi:lipopolysaccharide export system permease protein
LVAVSGFIESGEWIAAQAAGFGPRQLYKPLVACALAVAAAGLVAQETVLAVCRERSRRLWRERVHPEWEWEKYFDLAAQAGPKEFLQARLFLPKEGRLERPTLEIVGPGGVESQIDARAGVWDGVAGRWVFYDGVARRFSEGSPSKEEAFRRFESQVAIAPRLLVPRAKKPAEMTLRELAAFLGGDRPAGLSRRELAVELHAKLAYPWTNVVLCLLGIPLALRLRGAPRLLSFCAALAASFGYLWLIELGKSLGASGRLAPAAAGWVPHLVLAAAGAAAIARR